MKNPEQFGGNVEITGDDIEVATGAPQEEEQQTPFSLESQDGNRQETVEALRVNKESVEQAAPIEAPKVTAEKPQEIPKQKVEVAPVRMSKEMLQKTEEKKFIESLSPTRTPGEIARVADERNKERPLWKKALFIGRVTPENLEQKEKEEGAKFLELINKGDFAGARSYQHENNNIRMNSSGIFHDRLKEGYKYATPKQIAEVMDTVHPEALKGYPREYLEYPGIKKSILRHVSPNMLNAGSFSHLAKKIDDYKKTGLIFEEDATNIYSSDRVQNELKKLMKRYHPNSPEGEGWDGLVLEKKAKEQLKEFIDAGAITPKQADKLRKIAGIDLYQ